MEDGLNNKVLGYFLLLLYPKISYLPLQCPQHNQNLRIKNWAYSTMHGICSASILFCPHKCCFLAQLICVPLSLYLPWFQCMVSLWTNSNNTCTYSTWSLKFLRSVRTLRGFQLILLGNTFSNTAHCLFSVATRIPCREPCTSHKTLRDCFTKISELFKVCCLSKVVLQFSIIKYK